MVINKVKILKILLILSLMVLVLSNLILIFSQKINDNPDEEVHFKAVNYYENNNLPPNFLDEKIIPSYSVHGESRLTELDIYYFLVGKFIKLFSIFNINKLIISRMFNFILLIVIIILTLFLIKKESYIFIPFYLSTQTWYIFGYINNDAWGLFLNFILLYQLFYENSMFHRNLLSNDKKVKKFIIIVLMGILYFLLSLCKINYIISTVVITTLFTVINRKKVINKKMLYKFFWIFVISLMLLCVRIAIDYSINGLARLNMEKIRLQRAEESFKPPFELNELNKTFKWKERGISITNVIFNVNFYKELLTSFIGKYGNLDISLNVFSYISIIVLYIIGLVTFIKNYRKVEKNKKISFIASISSLVLLVLLVMYRSYTYDFQPQGRYLLPAIPIFGTILYKNSKSRLMPLFFYSIFLVELASYFQCILCKVI